MDSSELLLGLFWIGWTFFQCHRPKKHDVFSENDIGATIWKWKANVHFLRPSVTFSWNSGHMSRLGKAATFLLCFVTQLIFCWGYPRHQNSGNTSNFHEKNYTLLLNHHDRNILEGELLGVISRREPSLWSWRAAGRHNAVFGRAHCMTDLL